MRRAAHAVLIDAAGVQLAYREAGAGDPVFLISGTGDNSATWAPTMDALGARWRCVAIDLRDTGDAARATAPYTPADLAADCAAAIDALGTGACHVVGFSLGGAVGQELALARPDLVRSLVLLSTWARSDPWFVSQMRSWQVLRRAAADEHSFNESLEPWMFSPTTMADPALMARIHALWDDAPGQEPEAFCRQCDADIAHDTADRLPSLETPSLVVVGEHDICTPPRYADELCALLPRARLVTIADAGHCAVFERPEAVHAAIAGFLAEI